MHAGKPSSSFCQQEEAGEGTRPRGYGGAEPGHMHPSRHLQHRKLPFCTLSIDWLTFTCASLCSCISQVDFRCQIMHDDLSIMMSVWLSSPTDVGLRPQGMWVCIPKGWIWISSVMYRFLYACRCFVLCKYFVPCKMAHR